MANQRLVITPRLVLGAAIALMGIVLMLDRVGLADAHQAFRLWPIIIIAAGAAMYVQRAEHSGSVNGIILMAIGGWLLLNSLGIIRVGFWDLFWPVVLIAAGTALVMQTLRRSNESEPPSTDAGDRLTIFTMMSSVRRSSTSAHFRGGDLVAVMGGGRLDLRQATIPPGQTANLDVLAMMGGFEIFVPPSWSVATPIVPFMASVEDHRLPPLPTPEPASPTERPPQLVLRGFLMMSSVRIRS